MNKLEVQSRVLQNGKPLELEKFEWDEKTLTFSSDETNLVLDFSGMDRILFKTGSDCTFKTGSGCIFDTSFYCTFDTGSYCTFDTGSGCKFKTVYGCTFKTSSYCTFDTGSYCTFDTSFDCTFDTGGYSVVIRRDIYEVIELKENQKIKLNSYKVKGYEIISDVEAEFNGKNVSVELTQKQLDKIKKAGIL